MEPLQKNPREGLFAVEIQAADRSSFSNVMPDYVNELRGTIERYECYSIKDSNFLSMAIGILQIVAFRKPDIIICSEYRRSFFVNLFLIIMSKRSRHVVFGMNLSARPIVFQCDLLNKFINRIFNRSSKIVVHSVYEAKLFSELHNLPMSRFVFSHWGYDLPAVESGRFQYVEKPFVCMIGRNNRDLDTFANAVKLAGVCGVAIIPGYIEVGPELEAALEIHRDVPLDDCIDCIRNAAANLTLLRDDQRGAGHITVVTGLHLGVPQIHSDARVLQEYVPLKFLSQPVPIGDANAAAGAIRMVLASEASDLPERRRAFARQWLSHESATRRVREIILAVVEDRDLPLTENKWDEWLHQEKLKSHVEN